MTNHIIFHFSSIYLTHIIPKYHITFLCWKFEHLFTPVSLNTACAIFQRTCITIYSVHCVRIAFKKKKKIWSIWCKIKSICYIYLHKNVQFKR